MCVRLKRNRSKVCMVNRYLLRIAAPGSPKAEVGSIEFKEAGPQLLTFFLSRNNFAYFDLEPMD